MHVKSQGGRTGVDEMRYLFNTPQSKSKQNLRRNYLQFCDLETRHRDVNVNYNGAEEIQSRWERNVLRFANITEDVSRSYEQRAKALGGVGQLIAALLPPGEQRQKRSSRSGKAMKLVEERGNSSSLRPYLISILTSISLQVDGPISLNKFPKLLDVLALLSREFCESLEVGFNFNFNFNVRQREERARRVWKMDISQPVSGGKLVRNEDGFLVSVSDTDEDGSAKVQVGDELNNMLESDTSDKFQYFFNTDEVVIGSSSRSRLLGDDHNCIDEIFNPLVSVSVSELELELKGGEVSNPNPNPNPNPMDNSSSSSSSNTSAKASEWMDDLEMWSRELVIGCFTESSEEIAYKVLNIIRNLVLTVENQLPVASHRGILKLLFCVLGYDKEGLLQATVIEILSLIINHVKLVDCPIWFLQYVTDVLIYGPLRSSRAALTILAELTSTSRQENVFIRLFVGHDGRERLKLMFMRVVDILGMNHSSTPWLQNLTRKRGGDPFKFVEQHEREMLFIQDELIEDALDLLHNFSCGIYSGEIKSCLLSQKDTFRNLFSKVFDFHKVSGITNRYLANLGVRIEPRISKIDSSYAREYPGTVDLDWNFITYFRRKVSVTLFQVVKNVVNFEIQYLRPYQDQLLNLAAHEEDKVTAEIASIILCEAFRGGTNI